MRLTSQKRIAGSVLKCSVKRIHFDPEHLNDIKEAITKQDMRELINANIVQKRQIKGISRARANKILKQKRKGRKKGYGSRKGTKTARLPRKEAWMAKIRAQRNYIKTLREKKKIDTALFRDLYMKSKGGYFRNVRHIQFYLTERGIIKDVNKKAKGN